MTATPERRALATRLILSSFPKSWRKDGRAAEALGIAWDVADDEGREVLGAREGLDLGWLGLRARITAASGALPYRARLIIAACATLGGVALSSFLLIIEAWPPADTTGPSMLTAGTAVYGLWIAAAMLVGAGRETAARWTLVGSLLTTVLVATSAGALGLRRPALFLLAAMLLFNLLALGVRPLARATPPLRGSMLGSALLLAVVSAAYCRTAVEWHPSNTVYVGNALVLASIAKLVLIALGIVAVAVVGSQTGRRDVLPAVAISTGPWVVLAARNASPVASSAHHDIVAALATWVLLVGLTVALSMRTRATHRQRAFARGAA